MQKITIIVRTRTTKKFPGKKSLFGEMDQYSRYSGEGYQGRKGDKCCNVVKMLFYGKNDSSALLPKL